ncbi:MAG: HEAT repeat domain-containing protein, partial [Planctomycetes bacterium]|nr:HEAT repeat domain-containing protein [Planctomycetota bacterium]
MRTTRSARSPWARGAPLAWPLTKCSSSAAPSQPPRLPTTWPPSARCARWAIRWNEPTPRSRALSIWRDHTDMHGHTRTGNPLPLWGLSPCPSVSVRVLLGARGNRSSVLNPALVRSRIGTWASLSHDGGTLVPKRVATQSITVASALAVLLLPHVSTGGEARAPDAVDAFIQALKANDPHAVQRAMHGDYHRLARVEANVARLLAALRDADPRVRCGVASLIGSLRLRQGVQPLLPLLKDAEASVRQSAAYALGQLACAPYGRAESPDPAAVPALVALLKDPAAEVRGAAVRGLIGLKDPLATEHIIPLIKEKKTDVSWGAVRALGNIGDPRAAGALVESFFLGMCDHCTGAGGALAGLGGWGVEALLAAVPRAEPDLRARLIDTLGMSSHPRAAEVLLAMLDDPEIGRTADAALVRNGGWPPRPHEPFVDALLTGQVKARRRAAWWLWGYKDQPVVDPLLAAVSDVDAEVRACAAMSLGKLRDPRAVMPLLIALRDGERNVRQYAAEALGKLGDRRGVEGLATALRDAEVWVRRAAAEALGKLADARAADALAAALNDGDAAVRDNALVALAKAGDRRAVVPIVGILQDKASKLRSRAAELLGELKDRRAVPPLLAALGEEDAPLRCAAAEALGLIADPRAIEPLAALLREQRYDIPCTVAVALSRMGDQRGIPVLITELEAKREGGNWHAVLALRKLGWPALQHLVARLKDPDERTRYSVVHNLGRIAHPSTVEGVVPALKDPSPTVRHAAVQALAEIGDQGKRTTWQPRWGTLCPTCAMRQPRH